MALPTTVTPADNGLDLDVGQKSRISKQNWALGVVLIIIGLVEVFYGFKFIRLTLLVAGFLSWGKHLSVLASTFDESTCGFNLPCLTWNRAPSLPISHMAHY